MNSIQALLREARNHFGTDVRLLHDSHIRLIPIEAARLSKMPEPAGPLFPEDAVATENQDGYRVV